MDNIMEYHGLVRSCVWKPLTEDVPNATPVACVERDLFEYELGQDPTPMVKTKSAEIIKDADGVGMRAHNFLLDLWFLDTSIVVKKYMSVFGTTPTIYVGTHYNRIDYWGCFLSFDTKEERALWNLANG